MGYISDDDIRWLLQLLEQEDLAEIEVETAEGAVLVKAMDSVRLAPASVAPVAAAPTTPANQPLPDHLQPLLAPIAGTFFRSSSPGAKPFVDVGDTVGVGDGVALVEAMKLYHDVTSPVRGRIAQILVEDQQQVDAEQPLMLIDRSA